MREGVSFKCRGNEMLLKNDPIFLISFEGKLSQLVDFLARFIIQKLEQPPYTEWSSSK